jgi:cell division septation protein DedD
VADFLAQAQGAAQPAPKPANPAAAKPPASAKPVVKPTETPPPAAGVSGNFMVQVAAISSQDLADIELEALKKKGYNVVARRIPQDNYLHVQVGPFANRKDAEAMRDRIIADGFNAIIKP